MSSWRCERGVDGGQRGRWPEVRECKRGGAEQLHSCPRNRGVSIGVSEYRCCACLTPSQQKEAGVHSGVCASAKVKRWHGEATFVPCKLNPASMELCHAACVCMCVYMCVYVCVCVCVCKLAHTYQRSAIRPMYFPTRHQVGVRQRTLLHVFCLPYSTRFIASTSALSLDGCTVMDGQNGWMQYHWMVNTSTVIEWMHIPGRAEWCTAAQKPCRLLPQVIPSADPHHTFPPTGFSFCRLRFRTTNFLLKVSSHRCLSTGFLPHTFPLAGSLPQVPSRRCVLAPPPSESQVHAWPPLGHHSNLIAQRPAPPLPRLLRPSYLF